MTARSSRVVRRRRPPAVVKTAAVLVLAAVTAVTGLAGCHGTPVSTGPGPTSSPPLTPGPTEPTATVTPGPSRTPTPTAPPTDPTIVFAADGIGGYLIGATLADLSARGLVNHLAESPSCPDTKGSDTTGAYAGKVSLTFRSDKLSAIHTASSAYVTPSGAKVGMTLSALQDLYGNRGMVITGQLGNKAYSVRVTATPLAVVFFLDPTNTTVVSMSGGVAQSLEDAVRTGEGC
jgi:hypothetical protein